MHEYIGNSENDSFATCTTYQGMAVTFSVPIAVIMPTAEDR